MKEIPSQPLHLEPEETKEEMSRRDIVKLTGAVAAVGGLAALNVYLRTEEGNRFIKKVVVSDFGRETKINIDEESKKALNIFSETIESSFEKLGPLEKAAARELEKEGILDFVIGE